MLELLPTYIEVISKSIASCVTLDQLTCCRELINNLVRRYDGFIDHEQVAEIERNLWEKFDAKKLTISA